MPHLPQAPPPPPLKKREKKIKEKAPKVSVFTEP